MQSEELVFKEFNRNDIDLLRKIFQEPEVMKYTLDDLFSGEELNKYLANILKNNSDPLRKTFEYAVFVKEEYIGFADFTIKQKNEYGGIAEIGYLLLPDYWGCGYGTKIAGKLIDLCFNTHKLHKVIATCNSENIGSEGVMIKSGMKREGHLKKQRFKNNKWSDEYIYGLINPNLSYT